MLVKILLDDRLAHNYELRDAEDVDIIAQAMLPVTRSVPVNQLYPSYLVAMENRQPGNNFQITGIEILQGWRAIQDKNETYGTSQTGQKLLPENAAKACLRCFGTGKEQMLGGGVKESCDHRPLTEAEDRARIQERLNQIEKMRAQIHKPAPSKLEIVKPKVKAQKLQCTVCGRKVSTFVGWQPGEVCGLPTGTHKDDGSPVTCEGKMKVV